MLNSRHLFRNLSLLLLIFFLILGSWGRVWGQSAEPLNLVLLIDSSGSMQDSDPQTLRETAAYFLLDYVQALGVIEDVSHRFAVATFSDMLLREGTVPLTALEGSAAEGAIISLSEGDTDFEPALEFALQQLEPRFGAGEPMAVVLFTDGLPNLEGWPDPVPPSLLDAYFQGLQDTIEPLKEAGVEIFVIALGEGAEQAAYWGDLIPPDHYRGIDETTSLVSLYRELLTEELGLEAGLGYTLEDGEERVVKLQPYLEDVVFSAFKESPEVNVDLLGPEWEAVPTRGGGEVDRHVVYAIDEPPGGAWRIRVSGGSAQLWIDRRFPTLELVAPSQPQALGSTPDVEGWLFSGGERVVDPDLELYVSITGPDGEVDRLSMEYEEGLYRRSLLPLEVQGSYTLTLAAEYEGREYQVDTQPQTISAFPVPILVDHEVSGSGALLTSSPVTLTAMISNHLKADEGITVSVALQNAVGDTVETISLHDDGTAPDVERNDGVYAGTLRLPATVGEYTLMWQMQGETVDQVVVKTATATELIVKSPVPDVTPTPVAFRTPKPPSDDPLPRGSVWASYLVWILVAGVLLAGGWGLNTAFRAIDLDNVVQIARNLEKKVKERGSHSIDDTEYETFFESVDEVGETSQQELAEEVNLSEFFQDFIEKVPEEDQPPRLYEQVRRRSSVGRIGLAQYLFSIRWRHDEKLGKSIEEVYGILSQKHNSSELLRLIAKQEGAETEAQMTIQSVCAALRDMHVKTKQEFSEVPESFLECVAGIRESMETIAQVSPEYISEDAFDFWLFVSRMGEKYEKGDLTPTDDVTVLSIQIPSCSDE